MPSSAHVLSIRTSGLDSPCGARQSGMTPDPAAYLPSPSGPRLSKQPASVRAASRACPSASVFPFRSDQGPPSRSDTPLDPGPRIQSLPPAQRGSYSSLQMEMEMEMDG